MGRILSQVIEKTNGKTFDPEHRPVFVRVVGFSLLLILWRPVLHLVRAGRSGLLRAQFGFDCFRFDGSGIVLYGEHPGVLVIRYLSNTLKPFQGFYYSIRSTHSHHAETGHHAVHLKRGFLVRFGRQVFRFIYRSFFFFFLRLCRRLVRVLFDV